jgi:hypothetical protein
MIKQRLPLLLLLQVCLAVSCSDNADPAPKTAALSVAPAASTADSIPEQNIRLSDTLIPDTRISTESSPEPATDKNDPENSKGLFQRALRSWQPAPQSFTARSDRDTQFVASDGTVIGIRANSFQTASGAAPSGPVTLRVREYYGTTEILSHGLCTQSGSTLLESGGMVHIEAAADGELLQLRPGAEATIALPVRQAVAGMELFRGVDRGGWIDWLPAQSSARLLPAYVPAAYPGGIDALTRHFDRNIDIEAGFAPGRNNKYALRLRVDASGNTDLIDISPAPSEKLARSVRSAVTKLSRWKPATRAGLAATDTAMHYLSFEWSLGIGGTVDTLADGTTGASSPSPARAEERAATITQYYVLKSSQLGWINCDRFINDTRPRNDLFVRAEKEERENIKLIFRDQRSIMNGVATSEGVLFSKIPDGEPVIIIGMKYKDGNLLAALAGGVTGAHATTSLKYAPMDVEELRVRLTKLRAGK